MSAKMATALFAAGLVIAPGAAYAAGNTYGSNNSSGTVSAAPTSQGAKESADDSAITAKIKAEFAKDRDLSASDIKVRTDKNGLVTLSGDAQSKTEADKAVSIARKTQGVATVKNEIKVGPATGSTTGMMDNGSNAISSGALGGTVGAKSSSGMAHKPN